MDRMTRKRRLWAGSGAVVGAAVALTTADSAVADGKADDYPGGSIDTALNKIFANEGGESGLGFTPLEQQANGNWSFSVPALNKEQLEKAVTDNTLARRSAFAIHMSSTGQYEGWQRIWDQRDREDCPMRGGVNFAWYVNHSGECWFATDSDIRGSWTIRDDMLCLDPVPVRLTDARCNRITLVLNSVVMWDEAGKMFGKGSELRQGKRIERAYLD